MAAKDFDSSDVRKQEELDEMTTCCICTEVYTDPKALPCIHTFCMKCLLDTGLKTSKGPGDEMPCPICRRQFKIPPEGFSGLPKHFFIERLIQVQVAKVQDPSEVTKALCSLCLEESEEERGTQASTADIYCVDCKYKLCEECCCEHRKFKATKNHKLISVNENERGQNVVTDLVPMVCEVHEEKALDLFCLDCKVVVCAICFTEEHKVHEGSHINKCVDGFRKKIRNNTQLMNWCIADAQVKKAELVKVKEDMQKRVESLESDVEKRKNEVKQLADKNVSRLLQCLCSERQSRLKEIQMTTDDIDAYLSNLESYNSYCQRITDKGSASEICSAFSDLSFRALELQQKCQPIIERRIQDFKFCFRQFELEEFLQEDCGNLIGEIEEEGDLKPKKRSKQILLAEQSNEIDILSKENEGLRKQRANYNDIIEKLKQELENNKTAIIALQTNNDKLKQEFGEEKTTSISLQTSNDKFLVKLDVYKAKIMTLETNVKELRTELHVEKTAKNSLQTSNDKEKADYKAHIDKLKQELEKSKTVISALQVNNDKLKQELDAEKTTVRTFETKAEKLRKEQDELRYRLDRVLVRTIRTKAAEEGKKSIRGLTILDKELFVLSGGSSSVEVYDSMKFSFSRRWNLKELNDPWDMGSCNRNKCLYILDYKGIDQSKEILRVDPNGNLIKKWSTGDDLGQGLSVTVELNVILSKYWENKLNEYSPDGQLIREINLSSRASVRRPLHAIKLTNGHFVVSHVDRDLQRVCIVDAEGKIKKSFGGERGSAVGQMNDPVYLCVDANGFVMVVDRGNSRVLLLNSDLEFKREILSNDGKHGLRYPERILLDESNGRLFVADNKSKYEQLLVFNLDN